MPFRPDRLAFLIFLQFFQLPGNALATPVRHDETSVQAEVDAGAESDEPSPALPLVLPASTSVPVDVPGRPSSANASGLPTSSTAPPANNASRGGEALANENISSRAGGLTTDFSQPDPLARTLHSLVNVVHRPGAVETSPRLERDDTPIAIDFGEEGRAAVLEAKEVLAGAIRTVLDPRAEADGRISFSLAGLEGFHLLADGSSWTLGFGDSTLTSFQANAREGETDAYRRGQQAAFLADSDAANANALRGPQFSLIPGEIMQAIDFARAIFEYPLTWFLIALFIIFRIAAAVVSTPLSLRQRWRATRRHRSHRNTARRSQSRSDKVRLDSPPAKP